MSFDPHLIDHGEGILLGVVEVDEANDIEVLFVLDAGSDLYALAQIFVEGIVGITDVGA